MTNDKVYNQVREIAFALNIGEKIRAVVTKAYENETPETRQKYVDAEKLRRDYWKKIRTAANSADAKDAKKLRVNADVYNDYGQGELALKEIERAITAENQDDFAECLAIRGRAKAVCGDFSGALDDTNKAVETDPNNLYNFLNRADVQHMRGEYELALEDISRALQIDEKNAVSYKLQGNIFDELGQADKAEESYRRCYELTKKNPNAVPLKYLEKIDPKAAEKIRKEKLKEKKSEKSDVPSDK